ncbi:MAG: DNA polymerase-3 subunit delta [Gammaproteobacteria bacterium]|jgi:DNA polymerase-3 subunit delta
MRLSAEQLSSNLQRNGLLPIYLIGGDEPLQAMEASDQIRQYARETGADRSVLIVETGFDWGLLLQENANMGLFSSSTLIELRMAQHTPGKPGSEALIAYAENASKDNVLLININKLDKRMLDSRWCKAIDKIGAIIQIRPIDNSKLPEWICRRLKLKGKIIERNAADLIAQRTEGNLLATQQEIEKLCLILEKEEITLADIQDTVINSSRYDVFSLIEYALRGKGSRIINMLRGLRQEGTEPIIIYGAIMWELRRICSISAHIARGIPRDRVFNDHRVWYQRQTAINAVLSRFDDQCLGSLLQEAITIDKSLKGVLKNNPWEQMEQLLFRIGGIK